jgi:hypothetical protein
VQPPNSFKHQKSFSTNIICSKNISSFSLTILLECYAK